MSEEENEKQDSKPAIPPEARVLGLFQDIDEGKAEEIIYALKLYQIESDAEIEFLISSPGGVAADMFTSLADSNINIKMISTSEIKTAVIVDEADVEEAARVVHDGFGLGDKPILAES